MVHSQGRLRRLLQAFVSDFCGKDNQGNADWGVSLQADPA
jgi:hypothetical protein